MKRLIVFAIVTMFAMVFLVNTARACSMPGPAPTAQQKFDKASVVFVGEVISLKTRSVPFNEWWGAGGLTPFQIVDVTFYVVSSDKGAKKNAKITVTSAAQSSACGVEDWAATRWKDVWKVFAFKTEKGFVSSLGDGTEFLSRPKIRR